MTELNGEIKSCTTVVGDFNIPLTTMNRPTRQKISKQTQDTEQHNKGNSQKDICRILYQSNSQIQNTHTSQMHTRTFSRRDYMLKHELSLNRF